MRILEDVLVAAFVALDKLNIFKRRKRKSETREALERAKEAEAEKAREADR